MWKTVEEMIISSRNRETGKRSTKWTFGILCQRVFSGLFLLVVLFTKVPNK